MVISARRSLSRWTALAGLLGALSITTAAFAKPLPGERASGFHLFARASSAIGGNRVSCGIASFGAICTDSTGNSTAGGGFWPLGTRNQYIFSSGLQVAAIVDSAAPMSWAGQPEGAFFFSVRGSSNAAALTKIYRSTDPGDAAEWPDAARVPQGDATADLFAPTLQGRIAASAQDLWFLNWEGDPSKLSGREHTLGVLVENRVMAFNATALQDVIYVMYTLYNITCDGTVNPACYASARPAMRDTLNSVSHRFQVLNNARFAPEILPVGGYRFQALYVSMESDPDVTVEAGGSNYTAVNVPAAMGYAYHQNFVAEPSWVFDQSIYGAPFFPGAGFVGMKYIKGTVHNGVETGLSVFGSYTGGGTFSDPANTQVLYRYMTGTSDTAFGDDVCNQGDVRLTHICYINEGTSGDARYFQSNGPVDLGPGEFASIVVAYVFAAPVAVGGCDRPSCQAAIPPQLPTGSVRRFMSPDSILLGVNTVDSMTGYRGFTGDANGDGIIQQSELSVLPGSLLGKALTAQAAFDGHFVVPQAPAPPSFYLLPGDKEVTLFWQPSATEASGDDFFATAQQPALYDPNYRLKDVIGYRVYRGNSADPAQLRLLAQYNYTSGDAVLFTDHTGQVNGGKETGCAPDLGVFLSCASAGVVNGVATITPIEHDVVAEKGLVQGTEFIPMPNGKATTFAADTAVTGRQYASTCGTSTPCPALQADAGVPFFYVDETVTNNRTYFYAVAAFDLNSIRSGPSSLESSRLVKSIVPAPLPAGVTSSQSVVLNTVGRGVVLGGTAPTLDPVTGEFSGPQPPSDAATASFVGQFLSQLFQGVGTIDITLTDILLGDARGSIPVVYTFRATGPKDTIIVPFQIQQTLGGIMSAASAPLAVAPVDPGQARIYGVDPDLSFPVVFNMKLESYQVTNAQGRGCTDGTVAVPAAFPLCRYFGPRWFAGANESTANPNAGNTGGAGIDSTSNAGSLPGIARIQWPSSLANYDNGYRITDAVFGGAIRAADMKVYWGSAGKVDSVIDVTHNVVVPFQRDRLGGGFGLMTVAGSNAPGSADGRPGLVTVADLQCLDQPFSGNVPTVWPCTAGAPFTLSDSAVAGPVAFGAQAPSSIAGASVAANPGFAMYIAGHTFTFELAPGAPVPNHTVWTLRSYIGGIFQSLAGNYSFVGGTRSFSAIGADLRVTYTADNRYVPIPGENGSVANVHTVPDPYYWLTSALLTSGAGLIRFVNLPPRCAIRIYTASGILVRVLQHDDPTAGYHNWDIRNRNGQLVGSGVYFYSVEDSHTGIRKVGRMTIVE